MMDVALFLAKFAIRRILLLKTQECGTIIMLSRNFIDEKAVNNEKYRKNHRLDVST